MFFVLLILVSGLDGETTRREKKVERTKSHIDDEGLPSHTEHQTSLLKTITLSILRSKRQQ